MGGVVDDDRGFRIQQALADRFYRRQHEKKSPFSKTVPGIHYLGMRKGASKEQAAALTPLLCEDIRVQSDYCLHYFIDLAEYLFDVNCLRE